MASTTRVADLFVPEVIKDLMEESAGVSLGFVEKYADVDYTLQGRPGNTITVPQWEYIGDAEDVAEGEAIPVSKLSTSDGQITIKKAGKGVEITDEAVLSGMGDPIGTASRQIGKAIAAKERNDFFAAHLTGNVAQHVETTGDFTVEDLNKGLDVFEDEEDAEYVLYAHPNDASALRVDAGKNWLAGSAIGADRFVKGSYGEVLGVTIVRSRAVAKGAPILSKEKAVAIYIKRDIEVEDERIGRNKKTLLTGDQHYAVHLKDPSRVVIFNPEIAGVVVEDPDEA